VFYLDIGIARQGPGFIIAQLLGQVTMKNVILVAVLAVALTAACLWFLLSDNQAPHSRGHRRFNSSCGLRALSPAHDSLRDKSKPRCASLGSIPEPMTTANRVAFWARLHQAEGHKELAFSYRRGAF
jgi:hypothetical protein